jgi:hypothetical protein
MQKTDNTLFLLAIKFRLKNCKNVGITCHFSCLLAWRLVVIDQSIQRSVIDGTAVDVDRFILRCNCYWVTGGKYYEQIIFS